MRIALLVFVALFALAQDCFAATRTSSQSGNWDDTATWGGLSAPIAGDTANITGGFTVTVQAGHTEACGTVNVASASDAALTINGTITIATMNMGAGAAKDGTLTLGPGSVLTVTSSHNWRNGRYRSTATQNSPATINGAGSISGAGVTGPRMSVILANVLFNGSGTINLLLQDTAGAYTSELDLDNCMFVNVGAAITLGATDTPSGTSMSVTDSDFRSTQGTTLTVRKAAGGSSIVLARNTINGNTGANRWIMTPTTSGAFLFAQNVCVNLRWTTTPTAGQTIVSNYISDAQSATPFIYLSDSGAASTVMYNYFQDTLNNAYPIFTTGSGGSGTHNISSNLFYTTKDGAGHADYGDFLNPGATPLDMVCAWNVLFDTGEVVNGQNGPAFGNIWITNNTIAGYVSGQTAGDIYNAEGPGRTGSIFVWNNVHRANGSATTSLPAPASGVQVITNAGYNDFFNLSAAYSASVSLVIGGGNTTKTVPGSGDITNSPALYDESRTLQLWNAQRGSGTATVTAGETHLLLLNGFDSNVNAQTATPTTRGVWDLFRWVRQGYYSTSDTTRNTGNGGTVDIGIGWVPSRGIVSTGFF